MSEQTHGWFHCGRCGQLFQAPLEAKSRTCSSCGRDPSTFGEKTAKSGPTGYAPLAERRASTAEEGPLPQKRAIRKRRPNSLIYKILAGWLTFTLLLAFFAGRLWQEDDKLGTQVRNSQIVENGPLGDEERAILEEAMPEIGRCLGGFLGSGTPEQRNQYVHQPISVAGKMARFYSMNPLVQINPTDVKNSERRLINLEKGPAIATVWEVADGRKLDAVFYKDDGEWRLDWEQFVRYGELPWPLFLAGSGSDAGEFRLTARTKMVDEKSSDNLLSIVLYSPRFGFPGDPGNASPEFLVPRDSEDGRLLAAAFRAERAGKSPFDGALTAGDPDGMIRLRVRVKRSEGEKGRSFAIERVIACHWLANDEPGLAPLSEQQVLDDEARLRDADQPLVPKE